MDKYYVSGVKADAEGNCEICADNEAHFFTLYERNESGESQAVIDCTDRRSAEAAMWAFQSRSAYQRELWEMQQQVNALAAEGAVLKSAHPQPFGPAMMAALDAYAKHADDCPEQGMLDAFFILRDSINVTTPATDAAIREIEARAWADALCMVKSAIACDSVDNIEFLFKGKVDQLRAGEVSND